MTGRYDIGKRGVNMETYNGINGCIIQERGVYYLCNSSLSL